MVWLHSGLVCLSMDVHDFEPFMTNSWVSCIHIRPLFIYFFSSVSTILSYYLVMNDAVSCGCQTLLNLRVQTCDMNPIKTSNKDHQQAASCCHWWSVWVRPPRWLGRMSLRWEMWGIGSLNDITNSWVPKLNSTQMKSQWQKQTSYKLQMYISQNQPFVMSQTAQVPLSEFQRTNEYLILQVSSLKGQEGRKLGCTQPNIHITKTYKLFG